MSISKPDLTQVGNYLNKLPPNPSSIQQLDKWSKGANPEIPGWAAAGALQQKTQELDRQKLGQGAATGPMPTILDQLRQKAAMVEQQRQQQAMAQQMQMLQAMQAQQQQGAPGIMGLTQPNQMPATSSGVTPETASSGVTAAEGGLMQLPVDQHMFNYAQGGVIGFDGRDRSDVPRQETYAERDERMHNQPALTSYDDPYSLANLSKEAPNTTKKDREKQAKLDRLGMLQPLAAAGDVLVGGPINALSAAAERAANLIGIPRLGRALGIYDSDVNAVSVPQVGRGGATPYYDMLRKAAAEKEPQPQQGSAVPAGYSRQDPRWPAGPVVENEPLTPADMARTDSAKLGGGTGKKVNSSAAPAGVASLVQNPHTTQLDAALAKTNAAPTPGGILENETALMPELLKQPYMAEARKRIEAEDARRKEQLKGRGTEHLLDVLNGIAYGGFGAAGLAHRNATQKEQAADAAHNAEINKLLTELDKGERGEAAGKLTSRMAAFGEEKKAFSEAERNKLTSLATVYGVDQRAAEAAAHNLTQLEVARINALAHNRPGEQMQLLGQYLALKVTDPAKAKTFLEGYKELNETRTGREVTNMDKAIDNVTNMAKGDFAMQKRFRDNPDLFRQKVQEVYNMMNQAGGGGNASNATTGANNRVLDYNSIK